jgi:hypothetical protein
MNVPRGGGSPYGSYGRQARDYAASSAAPVRRSADAVRALMARYLSPEQIRGDVGRTFEDVTAQAGSYASRLGEARTGTTTALSSLASALPNLNPDMVANMLSGAARSGIMDATMQEALTTDVGLARTRAESAALRRREEELRTLEMGAIEKEEEAGRIEADVLTPAMAMGQAEGAMLDRRMIREQLKDLPLERRAKRLANMAAKSQLTTESLQQAGMRVELQRMGFSVVRRKGKTFLKGSGGVEIPVNDPKEKAD